MAAASWASKISRGAISAKAEISSAVRNFSSSRPPFITSVSWRLENSFNALAKATGSPADPSGFSPVKAIAVGPVKRSRTSKPNSSTAKRTKVFL